MRASRTKVTEGLADICGVVFGGGPCSPSNCFPRVYLPLINSSMDELLGKKREINCRNRSKAGSSPCGAGPAFPEEEAQRRTAAPDNGWEVIREEHTSWLLVSDTSSQLHETQKRKGSFPLASWPHCSW